jgi:hypothetical protein
VDWVLPSQVVPKILFSLPVVLVMRYGGDFRLTMPEVKTMSNVPRPPTDIIQAIDLKAIQVREAAARLTQCIEDFEIYLSSLNGRVETYTWGTHPDSTHRLPIRMGLGLFRRGKSWVICFAAEGPIENVEGSEWSLLKEASLKIKIAGIRMFPDLLEAIEKSQMCLMEQIQKAVAEYNIFATAIKAKDAIRRYLPRTISLETAEVTHDGVSLIQASPAAASDLLNADEKRREMLNEAVAYEREKMQRTLNLMDRDLKSPAKKGGAK